jgi:hypothetical protein
MPRTIADLYLTSYTYLQDAANSKWTNQEISNMLLKEKVTWISGAGRRKEQGEH